jgi:phosphocarrier protein FPr
MVQGSAVQIAAAGGIDDPDNPIGTDAMKVHEAIQSVYSDDGVVVLVDLGSAIMSTEMAVEFLPEEQQANVRLCGAPLVEGAIAASVQASVGGTLDQVCEEALGALRAKQDQMPEAMAQEPGTTAEAAATGEGREVRVTIENRMGLHARPAAQFVSTANRFASDIEVRKEGKKANAKSINQVATLGARLGDEIAIIASGPDAQEALTELEALVRSRFGEEEELVEAEAEGKRAEATARPAPPEAAAGTLAGIPASPGIAIGPAAHYRVQQQRVESHTVDDPSAEWQRLLNAIQTARQEIDDLRQRVSEQGNQAEAAIFQAHMLFLEDPSLLEAVQERILSESINAGAAWQTEIDELAAQFRQMTDEYMQGRAADVLDVGQRVLRHLLGVQATSLDLSEPSIVLASDLTPSDTAQFEPSLVLGICTERGGATSHSAILARAFGIPAIVGVGPSLQTISQATPLAIDGQSGEIWVEPEAAQLEQLEAERSAWLEREAEAKAAAQEPAVTRDGQRIEVAANIGNPNDVPTAVEYGAEGVGLFRTEFLFLDRDSAPSEEEQYDAYRRAAEALSGRPLIIRTLDVGGDKPLPYFDIEAEDNPFLGWRGIRLTLDRRDIFITQLRAILRAGHGQKIRMMFPMVGTLYELQAARQLVSQVQAELAEEGVAHHDRMPVGIMIEVPAAVALADQLAPEVDFFSIGTNDLTQYVMAADRGNAHVSELADALQPAVLRMIQQTVRAGHDAGIWVGMCGELAGNATATPLLVGLGLDELSMNAPAIPAVKEIIRNLDMSHARQIADGALQKESAAAVKAYLEGIDIDIDLS